VLSRILLAAFALLVALLSLVALLAHLDILNPQEVPVFANYLPFARNDEEALRKDPANPYLWCAAAESLAAAGKKERARYAVERCAELAPNHATILMRVTNFYFSEGDNESALKHAARILKIVPDFDSIIFGSYRRLDIPVDQVLATGLPGDGRAWQAYFQDLLSWAKPEQAAEVWEALGRNGFASSGVLNRYVEYLIQKRMYETAAATWAARLGEGRGAYLEREFLFNGGFEHEFSGNAFDWRLTEASGVEVARFTGGGRQGSSSLRLEFSGEENVAYSHTVQTAWLPAGSYRFRAHARSEDLTTDQGVYFRIVDQEASQRLDMRTEQLTGTNPWTALELNLVTGGPGALVRVQLCRDASFKIESKIRGTAWIDDVSLARR
jgi:hypothetical protein